MTLSPWCPAAVKGPIRRVAHVSVTLGFGGRIPQCSHVSYVTWNEFSFPKPKMMTFYLRRGIEMNTVGKGLPSTQP